MAQTPYIFNQLVSFLPKDYFDRLVKKYNGNAYVKNYSCWNHLLVMVWAQLTGRRSLRDIETSLRAHSDKTYRMGIGATVCRSNIAKANAIRDVSIFREFSQEMMRRASGISVKDDMLERIARAFHLAGFFAIDSSSVSLKLSRFPWSEPQEGIGGVKLHTMYDLMRKVPRLCNITGHEERDQTFMEDYVYEPNCFYVLDRLYFKASGMRNIDSSGAFFVTRMKRNVVYEVLSDADIDGVLVLADQTIRFTSRWASQGYPENLRLIKYYSSENNEVLAFVTNNFVLDASTIALLYRFRWEIECFFYEKYTVMRSERESSPENQVDTDLLLRSTSHNDNHFLSPLSQSRRFLLDSQDLSGSRLGVRSVYAFSKASRFAFESARAYMSVVCIETCPRMSRI